MDMQAAFGHGDAEKGGPRLNASGKRENTMRA